LEEEMDINQPNEKTLQKGDRKNVEDSAEEQSVNNTSANLTSQEIVNRYLKRFSQSTSLAYKRFMQYYYEKKKEIRHYALVTVIALFTVVLFQNYETARFELLFWDFSAPKIILLILMLGVGTGFGYWLKGHRNANIEKRETPSHPTVH